jgi:beta-lactamase regulating signal transducer with metallopeptidase domain
MSILDTTAAGWLAHTAAGGGLLLLLTAALVRRTRQPARQQRLGEWGLAAALLVALLSAGPAWLVLPWIPAAEPSAAAEEPAWGPSPPPEPFSEAPVPLPAEILVLPQGPFPAEAPGGLPLLPEQTGNGAAEPESHPLPASSREPLTLEELLAALAALVYAGGACLLLGRWLLGHVALARLLRGAAPAPPAVARLFDEAAGTGRLPRLLISHRLRVPLSCGLWRPTVVLPAGLCGAADEEKLRWVFAHELTHLRRRDAWSCLLFGLGQVVYFYLPWFWRLRRQVRLCQEYVADAAAAGPDGAVADYAEFLLSLSAAPAVPLAAHGVSGSSSDLLRRVTMLLQDPLRVEERCPRRWLLPAAAGLLALAVVVAGVGVCAEASPPVVIVTDGQAPRDAEPAPAPEKRVLILRGDVQPRITEKVIIFKERPDKPGVVYQEVAPPAQGRRVRVETRVFDPVVERVAPPEGPKAVEKVPGARVKIVRPTDIVTFVDSGTVEVEVKLPPDKLEALRKALKKLEGNPDRAALEEARKEIEKVLGQRQGGRAVRAYERPQPQGAARGGPNAYAPAYQVPGYPGFPTEYYSPAAHGRLGIFVEPPSPVLADQVDLPKGRGLVITNVAKGTPAAKAGLKAHDLLVELGGKPVPGNVPAFVKMVEGLKADTDLEAVVLRRGRRETIKGLRLSAVQQAQHQQFGYSAVPHTSGAGVTGYGVAVGQPTYGAAFGQPAGNAAVLTTTFRTGDRFTSRRQEGSLIITVTGTVADGKAKLGEVHVQDGATGNRYTSLDGVPARYRDKVEHLLSISGQGATRVETK